MNLTQMRYFQVVAEQCSFTKAAELLYVTQPTLSRQIVELEEEFGVPLVVRTKPQLTLTRAGAFFLQESSEILQHCQTLSDKMLAMQFDQVRSLRIGYIAGIRHQLLLRPLREFMDEHPQLACTIKSYAPDALKQALQQQEVDLAFTLAMLAQSQGGTVSQTIAANPCRLVVPRRHPLARRKKVAIRELKDEHFILFERSLSPQTVDYATALCLKYGFSPSVQARAHDVSSLLMLVSLGKGIAFLSAEGCLPDFAEDVAYLDLEDPEAQHVFDVAVAYRKANTNPAVPIFLNKLILPPDNRAR